MSLATTLIWMERLISLAVVQQTAEFLVLRPVVADRDGIWRWAALEREFQVFGRFIARALGVALGERGFTVLLVVRLVAAAAIWLVPHPAWIAVLLASALLIAIRWRGTFNGGSDYMTLIVLSGLLVARCAGEGSWGARAAVAYVALQACLSYFIAGVVKLRAASWRDGRALAGFLRVFGGPLPGRFNHPWLLFAGGWAIVAFECSFPLALLGPRVCVAYLTVAMAFHGANAYLFGLNRFLLAWAAAYPAVWWLSARG